MIACDPPTATGHPVGQTGCHQGQTDGGGARSLERLDGVRGVAGQESAAGLGAQGAGQHQPPGALGRPIRASARGLNAADARAAATARRPRLRKSPPPERPGGAARRRPARGHAPSPRPSRTGPRPAAPTGTERMGQLHPAPARSAGLGQGEAGEEQARPRRAGGRPSSRQCTRPGRGQLATACTSADTPRLPPHRASGDTGSHTRDVRRRRGSGHE